MFTNFEQQMIATNVATSLFSIENDGSRGLDLSGTKPELTIVMRQENEWREVAAPPTGIDMSSSLNEYDLLRHTSKCFFQLGENCFSLG